MVTTLPYGSWPSPLTADLLATGGTRLGSPRLVGRELWWSEGIATEGGRQAIVRTAGPVALPGRHPLRELGRGHGPALPHDPLADLDDLRRVGAHRQHEVKQEGFHPKHRKDRHRAPDTDRSTGNGGAIFRVYCASFNFAPAFLTLVRFSL